MDEYTEDPNPAVMSGVAGVRTILLKGQKEGSHEFELINVRSWEVQDFLETHDASGEAISIKDIPNAGYRKVTVNVRQ